MDDGSTLSVLQRFRGINIHELSAELTASCSGFSSNLRGLGVIWRQGSSIGSASRHLVQSHRSDSPSMSLVLLLLKSRYLDFLALPFTFLHFRYSRPKTSIKAPARLGFFLSSCPAFDVQVAVFHLASCVPRLAFPIGHGPRSAYVDLNARLPRSAVGTFQGRGPAGCQGTSNKRWGRPCASVPSFEVSIEALEVGHLSMRGMMVMEGQQR